MNSTPYMVCLVALLGLSQCNSFMRGALRLPADRSWKWQQEGPTASQRTGTRLITSRVIVMSGFGPSKPSPKPATTGEALARNMQTKYEQLRREGGTTAQVHARVRGADRWFVVGYVCTEEGKTAEGIQGQKRLILDHAAKMYADLNSKKLVLETGYSLEGNSEVIPCKAKYSGEAVGVALDPLPEGPFFKKILESGVNTNLEAAKASTAASKAKYQ